MHQEAPPDLSLIFLNYLWRCMLTYGLSAHVMPGTGVSIQYASHLVILSHYGTMYTHTRW